MDFRLSVADPIPYKSYNNLCHFKKVTVHCSDINKLFLIFPFGPNTNNTKTLKNDQISGKITTTESIIKCNFYLAYTQGEAAPQPPLESVLSA